MADRDAPPPVAEAEPAPPAETPAARAAREQTAVDSAEQVLIRQIERAANQGLVVLSPQGPPRPAKPDAAAPAPDAVADAATAPADAPQDAAPVAAAPPPPAPAVAAHPPQIEVAHLEQPTDLAGLDDQEQIEATTVFDRDTQRALTHEAAPAVASVCLPDDEFDVGAWSNGLAMTDQLPTLRRQLVGEFDAPNPDGVRDLARLYIRFGFGAEAEALLAGFAGPPGVEDRALLVDLARAVEGRPVAPDGPLALADPCPGQHGLWLALGGAAPVWHDATSFAAVQAAFEALPADLRVLVGPGLVNRLLDAGHPAEARLIFETTVRPGEPLDPTLELAQARLAAAEGHPLEATQALAALVDGSGHTSIAALTQLVRVALDAHLPIPDRVVTDLRAAALEYRGSDREPELRALLTEALGQRAELPAAIQESRAAMHDLPAAAGRFQTLAVRALAEADPAAVGPAVYAETVLAAADLIARAPGDDPARLAIATRLVDLGLPDPALATLGPALAAGDDAARLLAAKARLRLGQPDQARAALGTLEGPEAAEIRARSFALDGAYGQALATLADHGLTTEAAPYAWPSGDWSRARAAAAADPERLAMAAYMTAKTGEAPPPAPSEDPAKLAPDAAFQEPLPPLEQPEPRRRPPPARLRQAGRRLRPGPARRALGPAPAAP